MATIEEFKESMTLYYSKSTGVIRNVISGVQDMSMYGDLKADMEVIQDFLVIPYLQDIFENKDKYKVNLDTKTVYKVIEGEVDKKLKALEEENLSIKLAMAEIIELVMGGEM